MPTQNRLTNLADTIQALRSSHPWLFANALSEEVTEALIAELEADKPGLDLGFEDSTSRSRTQRLRDQGPPQDGHLTLSEAYERARTRGRAAALETKSVIERSGHNSGGPSMSGSMDPEELLTRLCDVIRVPAECLRDYHQRGLLQPKPLIAYSNAELLEIIQTHWHETMKGVGTE